MQNERDRLKQVIEDILDEGFSKHIPLTSDFLADNLIAKGSRLLPCNVGDVLYYIDRCTNTIQTDSVKYFICTKSGIKPILEHHNTLFWDMYEFGKTVFLSREEAEKSLEEMKNNETTH